MSQSFDPPEFPGKVKFLIFGIPPSRKLGHKRGNFAEFARSIDINRKTLEGRLERSTLCAETQTILATKLGFRVDWPEWSTGSAAAFEERYTKEVPLLREAELAPEMVAPSRPSGRATLIYGGVAATLLLAVSFVFWEKAPVPHISQVRLFDESKSAIVPGSDADGANPQHTLTALEPRSSNNFEIKSAEKFFFAMGFVLNHLNVGKNGAMNVKFSVDGLSKDGVAWTEPGEYQYEDRWKEFDIAKSLGPSAVRQAFQLKEGEGFPIAVVIECKKWEELSKWNGAIRINIQDLNTGNKDQVHLQYLVNLAEPAMTDSGMEKCQAP
ncbi:hypothetical protein BSZ19_20235 [Bradyrhizobium japonicum]|uniref:Uncharacterized protein n=1 Tax=Bradyrhizobium japonicum TaxID=375 RepID=A0A1Y2JN40_BRAJP|nr:hypothetical protein [Bradyrhizobium japonicum]OSJ32166.1 hypothetical protein BSZ19_20235 [Bradyrhizobium japonicum]